jgi:hypothetical protein
MNSKTRRRVLDVLAAASVILLLLAGGATIAFGKTAAQPVTWFVDDDAVGANDGSSWADAFTGLQDALDAAMPGDAIWVAAGTYLPSRTYDGSDQPRNVSFLLESGVGVYGGFAGFEAAFAERSLDPALTVLTGDIGVFGDDTDNAYHVVYADGVTGAVLDGVTVTGGRAMGGGWANGIGGGLYVRDSLMTVSNCVFGGNKAIYYGGGLYARDSTLAVADCRFVRNHAGTNNYDQSTVSRGAGMYSEGRYAGGIESTVVTGCTFLENETWSRVYTQPHPAYTGGAGIYNMDCGLTVDRCLFERNVAHGASAAGGGMVNIGAGTAVTNSVFTGNSAYATGGGMANVGAADIIHCTFHRNGHAFIGGVSTASNTGGALYQYGMGTRVVGVLFSENVNYGTAGAIEVNSLRPYRFEITKSLFHGNVGGCWFGRDRYWDCEICHMNYPAALPPEVNESLFDVDPLLADPQGGDFHLMAGSPAIDAGLTLKEARITWLPLPDTDFDGDKRVVDGDGAAGRAADIGAFEYVPTLPELRDLIQGMADAGEIDGALAAGLLDQVDAAQAALDAGDVPGARAILAALILEIKALEDNAVTEAILAKAEAVQGALD